MKAMREDSVCGTITSAGGAKRRCVALLAISALAVAGAGCDEWGLAGDPGVLNWANFLDGFVEEEASYTPVPLDQDRGYSYYDYDQYYDSYLYGL